VHDDTALTRCRQQLLTRPQGKSVAEIVAWFGAIQAQDFGAALWAIGQRGKGLTAVDVERAIDDREIVRTWALRGTIHFVPAGDLGWMLTLTGARQNQRSWPVLRSVGLDQAQIDRGRSVLESALRDGPLTRPEIYEKFERAGLTAGKGRGLHILGYWAQAGLICLATHRGKQPTFALLDAWLAGARHHQPDPDAALRALAICYFQSRGPATERDFAWWSGLPLTAARKAIGLAGAQLQDIKHDGSFIWMHETDQSSKPVGRRLLRLLSPFDEMLVAYKDRTAYDRNPASSEQAPNFFGPTILLNGRLVGTWKKTLGRNTGEVHLAFAPGQARPDARLVDGELARLSHFWGRRFDLAP
jgi:hypothetical protein